MPSVMVNKGEHTVATIKAEEKWNDTGFHLSKGKKYRSWLRESGPIGASRPMRRVTRGGRLIREDRGYRAEASGQLFCFANDVGFAYFNNENSIELGVRELGDEQEHADEPAT